MTVGRETAALMPVKNGFFDAEARMFRRRALEPGVQFAGRGTRQRQSLTARLRSAIEHDELSLRYQPQYEIHDGRHCGVEALARWSLSGGESIAPSIFIPHAEKNGLIEALGAWVLREACTAVAAWRGFAETRPILCVNVSPLQISREFHAVLSGTLERTGFPAAQLELEITESILIERPAFALRCLAQWKQLGVRIALDDFGSGYSNLSYLSQLPIDRIKIDKSLTNRMTVDAKTAAIVHAVISLGAELGCTVLAEGVESEAQLTLLSGMGCQQVQGFLLAMPARADEARALLASNWGKRAILHPFLAARPTTESSYAF